MCLYYHALECGSIRSCKIRCVVIFICGYKDIDMKNFEVLHNDAGSRARTGVIHTDHGDVRTPAFMPVGTQATVKSLDVRDLHEIGSDIILNNTYHVHLRPGEDRIVDFGGLHQFQGWDKPILTDSGGFQVFSLGQKSCVRHCDERAGERRGNLSDVGEVDCFASARNDKLVKIDEDGVTFTSHIDGSKHRFTPEEAIRVQQKLGADIIMAFDQCTADDVSYDDARAAMELTHAWAARCVKAKKESGPHDWKQFLFGIVQGAYFEDLRRESVKTICSMDFDGIAIGGESIGYNMAHTKHILGWIGGQLPVDKPRYTMGVGSSPLDILDVVEQGMDMFDCVVPTRMARHASVFSREAGTSHKYRISLSKAPFVDDEEPICSWCACRYCKGNGDNPPVSRRYLHHLFRSNEILGARIATYHNLYFLEQFMCELRSAIVENRFLEFAGEWR